MSSSRPSPKQVEAVIRKRIRGGTSLSVDAVANELYVSVRTLQRGLADAQTAFGTIRREAQTLVALKLMTGGSSAAKAAAAVGLSRDHLCVLVARRTGLRPRQIVRAYTLSQRAARWRRGVPPRYGTKLYYNRMYQWRRLDAELTRLLDGLESDHPLAAWARALRRQARRPDYRRRRYRAQVRAARRREHAEEERRRREFWAWFEAWTRERDANAGGPPSPSEPTADAA